MKRILIFAAVLSCAGWASARAQEGEAGKARVYKESGGKPRELELFFPPNHDPSKAKVPGLILFHGGGWTGGTPAQFRVACRYFADRGLVTATVGYRMMTGAEAKKRPEGETHKRVCITDAKTAVRWFKEHAGELGVDPDRLIVGGGSAGGHISVLATTNPGLNDPGDPKGFDTNVAAYILFNPAFSPDDERDAEVDVLRHLKPGFPPAIVFFGTRDTWKKGWDAAHVKLKSLGVKTVDERLAEGQPHGFFNRDPWRTLTLIEADRFLARLGFLKGEPTLKPPPSAEMLIVSPANAKP